MTAGWSWAKAADATAFEFLEGDKAAIEANDRWIKLSGGLLPELSQLKLLSVGGAHTNGFLRAIRAGCRTTEPKLADESGKLNKDALCVNRAEFRDAVEHGLSWLVIHAEAQVVWPMLPQLVQKALNTQAEGQQSEVEVMLDVHSMVKMYISNGEPVDWTAINEAACQSLPPCSSYIGAISGYVREHGGDGELLNELSKLQKACECTGARRNIGGEMLYKLAIFASALLAGARAEVRSPCRTG